MNLPDWTPDDTRAVKLWAIASTLTITTAMLLREIVELFT
jgi:hypothetical protein